MINLKKVYCLTFGHKYRVVKEFDEHTRKLICDRCGSMFGMHDVVGTLIPWSKKLDDLLETVDKSDK